MFLTKDASYRYKTQHAIPSFWLTNNFNRSPFGATTAASKDEKYSWAWLKFCWTISICPTLWSAGTNCLERPRWSVYLLLRPGSSSSRSNHKASNSSNNVWRDEGRNKASIPLDKRKQLHSVRQCSNANCCPPPTPRSLSTPPPIVVASFDSAFLHFCPFPPSNPQKKKNRNPSDVKQNQTDAFRIFFLHRNKTYQGHSTLFQSNRHFGSSCSLFSSRSAPSVT